VAARIRDKQTRISDFKENISGVYYSTVTAHVWYRGRSWIQVVECYASDIPNGNSDLSISARSSLMTLQIIKGMIIVGRLLTRGVVPAV